MIIDLDAVRDKWRGDIVWAEGQAVSDDTDATTGDWVVCFLAIRDLIAEVERRGILLTQIKTVTSMAARQSMGEGAACADANRIARQLNPPPGPPDPPSCPGCARSPLRFGAPIRHVHGCPEAKP